MQTGFPFTIVDTVTGIHYLTNRPNQTCDPNQGGAGTVDQFFNTACFERRPVAATAEPGSEARNVVRGPGFSRIDLSIFKNIGFAGRHRIQVRVEAFNLFN